MDPITLTSLDDPRLLPFTGTTDRQLQRDHGLFVVEGETILRRVIASRVELVSVLATPRKYAGLAGVVPEDVPVFLLEQEQIERVIGFSFHHGVLACGRRPRPAPLTRVLGRPLVCACPELHNADNLGLIARTAAGLGVDGLLLAADGTRAFDRRTIRTSMGAVFTLPMVESDDVSRDLRALRSEGGAELVATVCDADAQPLPTYRPKPGQPVCVLIGCEPTGLPDDLVALCDRAVTVPMVPGFDSFNAAVAAGVVMYALGAGRGPGVR